MNYELTQHAQDAITKRNIPIEWLEQTMAHPDVTISDEHDEELEHRLKAISEYENRVLRVIVNRRRTPLKVVTVHFDRQMKGKL
jgi:uncharacterized DUF497 family protein